jgi:hypothetical protein
MRYEETGEPPSFTGEVYETTRLVGELEDADGEARAEGVVALDEEDTTETMAGNKRMEESRETVSLALYDPREVVERSRTGNNATPDGSVIDCGETSMEGGRPVRDTTAPETGSESESKTATDMLE